MMAKQFVTEIHQENSVVILVNGVDAKRYHRNPAEFENYNNPLVADLPEYAEITEGNKVHYWIWVPDLINPGTQIKKIRSMSSYEKKQIRKNELLKKKRELVEKYREMFALHGDNFSVEGTEETFRDGAELATLENKKKRHERISAGMNDTVLDVKTVF